MFVIGKKKPSEFYCNGGYLHSDEDECNRVIDSADEILQKKPVNADDLILCGNAHAYKNEYDDAIADFDEGIRLDADPAVTDICVGEREITQLYLEQQKGYC